MSCLNVLDQALSILLTALYLDLDCGKVFLGEGAPPLH